MCTQTRTTKAGIIEREIKLSQASTGAFLATVSETAGKKTTCRLYWLRRQESQIGGTAFMCEKPDGQIYDVLLDGRDSSCTCNWNTYRPTARPCIHMTLAQLALSAPEPKVDKCPF
jgi:hypothetical protein